MDNDNACQQLLSVTIGGGALLLTLTFYFLFIPPVLIAHKTTLWTLAHGDSDTPHGSKLATKRGNKTRKLFRGGEGLNRSNK